CCRHMKERGKSIFDLSNSSHRDGVAGRAFADETKRKKRTLQSEKKKGGGKRRML
ncbi:hypothetical protein CDAR_389041, partial [Caerostris darwini]